MSETRPEGDSPYRKIDTPPGNSHKEKAQKKEIRQVTVGRVKKKGMTSKLKDSFSGEDARSVGLYLLFDVALPNIQSLVVDLVQQGIERKVLGDSAPNRTRRISERRRPTNYGSSFRSSRDPRVREEPAYRREYGARERQTHDFDQVVIESRGEAEEILDQMGDLLERYEAVTVSDLYRMVGIRGSFVDDNWGWTDLRGAVARRVRDGYVLELPSPEHLDRRV